MPQRMEEPETGGLSSLNNSIFITQNSNFMKKIYTIIAVAFITTASLAFITLNKYIDIFKDLGIAQSEADEWIIDNFQSGGLFFSPTAEMRALLPAKKAEIVKALGDYIRKQVESPAFAEKYRQKRENEKPTGGIPSWFNVDEKLQTYIENLEYDVNGIEQELKRATGAEKTQLENALKEVKTAIKILKNKNDPNYNKYLQKMLDEEMPEQERNMAKDQIQSDLTFWNEEFPPTVKELIRKRLKEFLDITATIDFNAKLVKRDGRFYFADPTLEAKDENWKKLFRCGKETIIPARAYAQQWLNTLK